MRRRHKELARPRYGKSERYAGQSLFRFSVQMMPEAESPYPTTPIVTGSFLFEPNRASIRADVLLYEGDADVKRKTFWGSR